MDAWDDYLTGLDDGRKVRRPKPNSVFAVLDKLHRWCLRDKLSVKQRLVTCAELTNLVHLHLDHSEVLPETRHALMRPIENWLCPERRDPALQEEAIKAVMTLRNTFVELGKVPPLDLHIYLLRVGRGDSGHVLGVKTPESSVPAPCPTIPRHGAP